MAERKVVPMGEMQAAANGLVCKVCGNNRFWTVNNWSSLPGVVFRRRECRQCHTVTRTEEKAVPLE
jgi:hypothetical protein